MESKEEKYLTMEIKRINTYRDPRFSQTVLNQHGCFLADGEPYEVEIISHYEAIIRGREEAVYPEIISPLFTPKRKHWLKSFHLSSFLPLR